MARLRRFGLFTAYVEGWALYAERVVFELGLMPTNADNIGRLTAELFRAVRLVVEREREIKAFVPDECWSIAANFALSESEAQKLGPAWSDLLAQRDDKGNAPTVKARNAWLGERRAIRAERLGSYSTAATLATIPSLSRRLKSIVRYLRLCPWPR